MLLKLTDVILKRGDRRIAAAINFEATDGQLVAVRGPNGAGKSTLLRAIAGLLPIDGGALQLTGEGIEPDIPRREYCHYFGHLDGLKGALSVVENLTFFQRLYGMDSAHLTADEALQQVDLGHTGALPVSYLSAGMRKRVALARLLLNKRPLWLLDEPTSALDTASQERLGVIMQSHLDTGGLIVAATHLPMPGGTERVITLKPAPAETRVMEETWL